MTGDDDPADVRAHARSALEHLQQAATEMFSVAHAALDALEEAVSEPVDLGTMVERATRWTQVVAWRAWGGGLGAQSRPSSAAGGGPGPHDGDNPVEHIPLS